MTALKTDNRTIFSSLLVIVVLLVVVVSFQGKAG
jgi:hypothetical protein